MDDICVLLRRFYKVRMVRVSVACRGPVSSVAEKLADQQLVLARHDRLAGRSMAQVMQAESSELRIRARYPLAMRQNPDTPTFGMFGNLVVGVGRRLIGSWTYVAVSNQGTHRL